MSKPSFLTESLGRKSLSVVLMSILLLITAVYAAASSEENKTADRQRAYRQRIQSYIQTGQQEYTKGFFEQAVQTFLMAQEHEKYLTDAEREKLNELLVKSQIAVLERNSALETFRTVNELVKQDKLTEAKAYLEKIKNNEYLTKKERAQIAEGLRRITAKLLQAKAPPTDIEEREPLTTSKPEKITEQANEPNDQPKLLEEEVDDLYYRSIGFYYTGQLKKAREGFVKLAASGLVPAWKKKTIDNYLARIDKLLAETDGQKPIQKEEKTDVMSVAKPKFINLEADEPELVEPETAEPGVVKQETVMPEVVSMGAGQGSYIDQINLKRNTIRSYTEAVVKDAIAKARRYMDQGDFDQAKKAVDMADFTVNENPIHLGDNLFKEYREQLRALNDEIAERENKTTLQQEQSRREAATEEQQLFRDRMDIERANRIAELMENALTYQKQQHYQAALGQLESLLALDPQNEKALILKDTLEDMIFFRRQLEVEREVNKQRAEILLKTDESGIPYAEELTYPKDWREIIDKPTRQPDKPIGLDPIDAVVYEQLEQIVDLSHLTEGMTVADVIMELENSVDPPLQIQPNWRDLLEFAEVERTTPAGMDPLTGVKLRIALEILLAGLSSPDIAEISYILDEGVIQIATVETLPPKLVPRVYDITDLVGQPANFGGMMGGMGMGGMGGGMGMGGMGMGGMGGGMGMGGMGMGGGYGGGMGGGYGGGMGGGYGGGMGGGYGGGMGGGYGGMSGGYGGMSGGYGGMSGGMGGMSGGYGGMGGMSGGYGGMGGMSGGYGGMGGMGGGMYGGGMGMMGGGGGFIAEDLRLLIQETIEPDSWFELSDTGEGTITAYPTQQPKKLAVLATHEVHREIEKLLAAMRRALGNQISIEARFLVVSENFLEDIGLDVDFLANLGGKWGELSIQQDSALATRAEPTQVPLSLGGIGASAEITGGYGSLLDDLQVSFLLRATLAHRDAKAMTAPIVTVLSGESASFSIQRQVPLALPPIQQPGVTTIGGPGQAGTATGVGGGLVPREIYIPSGSSLSITPIITHDKKNVLLQIITNQNQFLGIRTNEVEIPIVGAIGGGEVQKYSVQLPETETTQLMTRVSIPDGGTLLLGGQKITAEVEREAGVPILSKVPILGRLFSNRSTIRDQKILLILVKPVIILQEEREAEAIAALESEF